MASTDPNLTKFNSLISSDDPLNWQHAADLGRNLGYSDADIASYVGQQIPGSKDKAASFLSSYPSSVPTPYIPPDNIGPATGTSSQYGYNGSSTLAPNSQTSGVGLLGYGANPTPYIPPDNIGPATGINIPADNVGPAYGTYGNVNPNTLASFDSAIKSKDYTGAYKTAKDAGYSDTDIANYIKSNSTKDGFSDPQINQWINAVNSKTTPASNGFDFWNTRGLGPQPTNTQNPATSLDPSLKYNQNVQFDSQGRVNIGTAASPNFVDPLSLSGLLNPQSTFMTKEQYLAQRPTSSVPDTSNYLANKGMQQYQDIVNFANAQGIAVPQAQAQLGNVTPEATSAYQLSQITSQDSPLMQLAQKSGERTAAGRGLLNSSISAGNAQAEMVKAAQPFALQDANAYQQQNLANQTAKNDIEKVNTQNQFDANMLKLQSGLDAAKQSYLSNQDYVNKANLAGTGNLLDMDKQYATDAMQASLDANKAGLQARNDINSSLLGRANTALNNADQTYTNAANTQNQTTSTLTTQNNASANAINQANNNAQNDAQLKLLDQKITQSNAEQMFGFDMSKLQKQQDFDKYITQLQEATKLTTAAGQNATSRANAELEANTKLTAQKMVNDNKTSSDITSFLSQFLNSAMSSGLDWKVSENIVNGAGKAAGLSDSLGTTLFGNINQNTITDFKSSPDVPAAFSSDLAGVKTFKTYATSASTNKTLFNDSNKEARTQTLQNGLRAINSAVNIGKLNATELTPTTIKTYAKQLGLDEGEIFDWANTNAITHNYS